MVEWCLLESPWSTAATTERSCFVGARPVLLVDHSVDRVHVRSLGIDLPSAGSRQIEGRAWRAFELMSAGRESAGSEDIELELGAKRSRVCLRLIGGPSLDLSSDLELSPGHAGAQTHSFLGRHVDLVYGPIDTQSRLVDGCASLDLAEFLQQWIRYDDVQEARTALIVKIARAIAQTVLSIGERPRKVLRRRRAMERVASVRQIDPAGIRWLARQPGNNLAERAGPRQRVLAVIREESIETLENRVVRDFLERSASECRTWLRENSTFAGTDKHDSVHRYSSTVRRLRKSGPLADIRRSVGLVEPNYVLQHDERYSQVWPWYVKLLRRQQEEDRLWRWSHRTFAEAVGLSVSWALDLLEGESGLPSGAGYERRLLLRPEQLHGHFVDPRTALTGWLIGPPNRRVGVSLVVGSLINEFESRLGTGTSLGELQPDYLVVSHDLFRAARPQRALVVWSRLQFDRSLPSTHDLQDLARSIGAARGSMSVKGLLLEPVPAASQKAEVIDQRSLRLREGAPVSLTVIQTPLRTERALEELQRILRSALLEGVVS